jgi:hypothetical protein
MSLLGARVMVAAEQPPVHGAQREHGAQTLSQICICSHLHVITTSPRKHHITAASILAAP